LALALGMAILQQVSLEVLYHCLPRVAVLTYERKQKGMIFSMRNHEEVIRAIIDKINN